MYQKTIIPPICRCQVVFADGHTQILDDVVGIRWDGHIADETPEPPPVQWVSCRSKPANVESIKALIARYGYLIVEFEDLQHHRYFHKWRATGYVEKDRHDDLILENGIFASELYWNERLSPQFNPTLIGRIVTGYGYE